MDKKAQEFFAKMRNVIRWGHEHGKTPPFSAGAMLAYNHFMDSLQDESSMVECASFPESADVEDYIMTMSKAGLESIIINADDEGLTDFLVAAAAVGCEQGRHVNFERVNADGNEPLFTAIELKLPVHTASEQEIGGIVFPESDRYFTVMWEELVMAEVTGRGNPFSPGKTCAYKNYSLSIIYGSSELEVNDLPDETELKDLVETLREAGMHSFVITDNRKEIGAYLTDLVYLRCRISHICSVKRTDDADQDTVVPGIRIYI